MLRIRKKSSKSKSSGFTLIELLVVVAIIGILASVVISSLNSARAKARDTKRVSELKQMQTAVEMYYAEHGEYPGVDGVWYVNYGNNWVIRFPDSTGDQNDSRLVKFYNDMSENMKKLPIAIPLSNQIYVRDDNTCQIASASAFIFYRRKNSQSYKLSTRLEQDCQKVWYDGGTYNASPLISGSKGRSYEVFELFDSTSSSEIPTW